MCRNNAKMETITFCQIGAEVTRVMGPRCLGAEVTRGRSVQEFIFKLGRDGLGPRCLGAEIVWGRSVLLPFYRPKSFLGKFFKYMFYLFNHSVAMATSQIV